MDTPGIDWNHLETWVYESWDIINQVEKSGLGLKTT